MSYADVPYAVTEDPFVSKGRSWSRTRAYCKISIGSLGSTEMRDITNRLMPFLILVRIEDGPERKADIEIDDRDGRLDIPPPDSPVSIELGWSTESMVNVFEGYIQDLEYSFSKHQGGRHMTVHARGLNYNTQIKQPMQNYMGAGAPPGSETGMQIPMSAFLQKAIGAAGASVAIHPQLAQITQDYWSQFNESAVHLLQRVAKDYGGILQGTRGNQFNLTIPGQDTSGAKTHDVTCKWQDNLISLRVRPWVARSNWLAVNQQWYSWLSGQWKEIAKQTGINFGSNVTAHFALPAPAPNSNTAGNQTQGMSGAAHYSGKGYILVNGEPSAHWNDWAVIQGVRPGVDGEYRIDIAEHVYSRQGYLTTLHVETTSK